MVMPKVRDLGLVRQLVTHHLVRIHKGMFKLILQSILWGLAGALLLPLSGIMLLIIAGTFLELFGVQGPSGGSGGFEMGLASIFLSLIPAGALSFSLVTLFRGVRRRRA